MDYKFWLPVVLTVFIGVVGLYYQRRSVILMEPEPKKGAMVQSVQIRPPLAFLITVLLCVIAAWVPYIVGTWGLVASPLHWTMTREEEEVVYGKTFRDETVVLDGKRFDHCTFQNVKLFYHAIGPTDIVASTFTGSRYLETDNDAAKGFAAINDWFTKDCAARGGQCSIGTIDPNGNITPLP